MCSSSRFPPIHIRKTTGSQLYDRALFYTIGLNPFVWSGCFLNVSLGRCFGHAHPGGDPGTDRGQSGEIISPRRSRWKWPGRGASGSACTGSFPCDLDKRQKPRREDDTIIKIIFISTILRTLRKYYRLSDSDKAIKMRGCLAFKSISWGEAAA